MAAERNITIYKGDTYFHQINVKDDSSQPIDLSDRAYISQIRKSKSSEAIIASFRIEILNAENGQLLISLDAGTTSEINTGIYYYDLQENNDSIITTLMGGKVFVIGEVSRV
jgi:hypothetical protein